MIYLLYERLRGEILKKREKKQRQKEGEKDKLRKDPMCLCFLLCGDEIEMRSFIFFKQKKVTLWMTFFKFNYRITAPQFAPYSL